jgi:hypothetical protein
VAKRISGRTFVVGAAIAAAGLITEAAITWVRKETPPSWAPITTAAATVLFAGLNAVVEKGREEPTPQPAYPGHQPGYGYQPAYPGRQPAHPGYQPGYRPAPAPPKRRGGFGIATVLVVVLLLCGGGGWAANTYVPKAVKAIRDQSLAPWERNLGNATERLATQAVTTDHGLTITVTSVAVYKSETVVSLTVRNDNADTAHMSVFDSAQLRGAGTNTLQPDVRRTDDTWTGNIGAGSDETGSIAFTGAIPARARAATLTFTTVLVGFDNITVNVPLTLTG